MVDRLFTLAALLFFRIGIIIAGIIFAQSIDFLTRLSHELELLSCVLNSNGP